MEEMIALKLSKNDEEAFLRVVDDMRFIEKAEKGGFKTLDELKKNIVIGDKYGNRTNKGC